MNKFERKFERTQQKFRKKEREKAEREIILAARKKDEDRRERLRGVPYDHYTNKELEEEIENNLDRRDNFAAKGAEGIVLDAFSTTLFKLLSIARERNMQVRSK